MKGSHVLVAATLSVLLFLWNEVVGHRLRKDAVVVDELGDVFLFGLFTSVKIVSAEGVSSADVSWAALVSRINVLSSAKQNSSPSS